MRIAEVVLDNLTKSLACIFARMVVTSFIGHNLGY